jgi:hypothetical protein
MPDKPSRAMITPMRDWLTLTQALARTMNDHAPGWTDRNDADPGVTMLEMLAFLAESLQFQRGLVDGGAPAASRIVEVFQAYEDEEPIAVRVKGERWERAESLVGRGPDARVFTLDAVTGMIAFGDSVHGKRPDPGSTISVRYRDGGGGRGSTSLEVRTAWPLPHRDYRVWLRGDGTLGIEASVILHEGWSGTKRPRFFAGRVLSADDLGEDQSYHLGRHRRHLQTLHGSGIAFGLQVKDDAATGTITIEPGLALDGHGREINLPERTTVAIPPESASPAWIVLEYAERLVDPVPVSTDEVMEPSRIEEGCRLVVAPSCESGAAVARVVREGDGWSVDPAFVPGRVR